jgi:hypothetical protein
MADPTRTRPPGGDLTPGEARLVERAGPPGPYPGPGYDRPYPDPRADDRSLGDLFGELARETSTLIRQEIELAKTEIKRDARDIGQRAGLVAAGGAVAYAGLIALLVGLGLLLGELLGEGWVVWLGVFLVGLATALVGYSLLQKHLAALKRVDPTPERTIQTLKEDKEWLKNETT